MSDPVELPALGNAFQLVLAGLFEDEPRTHGEVSHRLRNEDLARTGERSHAGSDVDGDTADAVRGSLDLSRVTAGSHFDVELANRPADLERALDRARRPVEGGEESVARRVDLTPAMFIRGSRSGSP